VCAFFSPSFARAALHAHAIQPYSSSADAGTHTLLEHIYLRWRRARPEDLQSVIARQKSLERLHLGPPALWYPLARSIERKFVYHAGVCVCVCVCVCVTIHEVQVCITCRCMCVCPCVHVCVYIYVCVTIHQAQVCIACRCVCMCVHVCVFVG